MTDNQYVELDRETLALIRQLFLPKDTRHMRRASPFVVEAVERFLDACAKANTYRTPIRVSLAEDDR